MVQHVHGVILYVWCPPPLGFVSFSTRVPGRNQTPLTTTIESNEPRNTIRAKHIGTAPDNNPLTRVSKTTKTKTKTKRMLLQAQRLLRPHGGKQANDDPVLESL